MDWSSTLCSWEVESQLEAFELLERKPLGLLAAELVPLLPSESEVAEPEDYEYLLDHSLCTDWKQWLRNWLLILITLILLLGAEGAHFMTIMNEFLTSSDSSVVAVDLVGLQAYYVVLSDSDSCYPAAAVAVAVVASVVASVVSVVSAVAAVAAVPAAVFVVSVLRQEEVELLNDVS